MNRDKIINDKLYREVANELGLEYSQVKDVIVCQFSFVRDSMEKKINNSVMLPKIGKFTFNEARDKKLTEIYNNIKDGQHGQD